MHTVLVSPLYDMSSSWILTSVFGQGTWNEPVMDMYTSLRLHSKTL